MNDKFPTRTRASWAAWLKDGLLAAEVDEATAAALCGHLADLGVLKREGEDDWRIASPFTESAVSIQEQMAQRLNDLCATEQGFALHYFLKHSPVPQKTGESGEPESSEAGGPADSNARLKDRPSSNLSNLQLVKKYGRQVQSFVELEKSFTDKLSGKHTTLKEARKMFNFILSRMKQKTEPRPWEQLSRRRHK